MTDSSNWQSWGIPLIVVVGFIVVAVVCVLVLRSYIQWPKEYGGKTRIDGKTVVITGGNAGIGKETAKELLRRGGRVILLCRDPQKARTAAQEISAEAAPQILVHRLDLASLESVRNCAALLKETEPKIDILINNAGVMMCPQGETEEGFETQFGTNHLGHFLLTLLLLDVLKSSAPSRIVNVSSLAHVRARMNWDDLNNQKSYSPSAAYQQSKLANILFTKNLAKKLEGTGVTVYSLHPGVINTELSRHITARMGCCLLAAFKALTCMLKTPKMGAQTTIYCAVDENIANKSGKYFSGCAEKRPSDRALNQEDAERLWNISLEMVGLPDFKI